MTRTSFIIALLSLLLLSGCSTDESANDGTSCEASFLSITKENDGWLAVSTSPFDGSKDTLEIKHPFGRIIAMSTSHVGFLDAIGCDSVICGVSGLDGVSSAKVLAGDVADVGYEAAPDYEKILELKPDLLVTYQVSGAKSPFLTKLKALGVPVFILHEHLETHPLARASYIRFFGALTDKMHLADSVLDVVSSGYRAIADSVKMKESPGRKVLVNIPYNDVWFIPGKDNYLSQLVRDVGGEVLGCGQGEKSSRIFLENAYALSGDADIWLNLGWCRTEPQLLEINSLFADILANIRKNAVARGYDPELVLWNDNKRLNPHGGNDLWESGVVRPDLILKDLAEIFSDDGGEKKYYRRLEK